MARSYSSVVRAAATVAATFALVLAPLATFENVASAVPPSVQATDLPTPGTLSQFNGVTCTSAGNCIAVGTDLGDDTPMYAVETAGSWARPIDLPLKGTLNAVSCLSAGNCVAVGDDSANPTNNVAMYVSETGGVWGGATEVTNGGSIVGSLTAVSCSFGSNRCLAVGSNGSSSISVVLTPLTNGQSNPLNLASMSATSVGCSTNNCVVVGRNSASGYPTFALYTGSWSSVHTLGNVNGGFSSVSCYSTTCVAAAQDTTNTLSYLYLLHTNSTTTALLKSGSPLKANQPLAGSDQGYINSVSCFSATSCGLVGYDVTTQHSDAAVITLSSPTFTYASTFSDVTAGSDSYVLSAVACVDASNCAAAGEDRNTTTATTVEQTAGTWGSVIVADAQAADAVINGTSCWAFNNCIAVGEDLTNDQPFYATETNGVWSSVDVSLAGDQGAFTAVSCPSAGNCVAVGNDTTTSVGISMVESAGTWAAPTTVPGADSNQTLTGVSCQSGSSCEAVGQDLTTGTGTFFSFDGTNWNADGMAGANTSLSGVSCTAVACVAVGQDTATMQPLWATNASTSWVTADVATADTAGFTGVSCPTTSECVFVGNDVTTGTPITAIDASGVVGSLQVPSVGSGTFNAVSCIVIDRTTTVACWAVGTDTATGEMLYAQGDFAANTETSILVPTPSGFATTGNLNAVSCIQANENCTAGGQDLGNNSAAYFTQNVLYTLFSLTPHFVSNTSMRVTFSHDANTVSNTLNLYDGSGTFIRSYLNFTSGSTITGLTSDATYKVGVVVIGDGIHYLNSAETPLATINLTPPALYTPKAGAIGHSRTAVAMHWGNVVNSASYTVKLYKGATFATATLVSTQTAVTTTSTTFAGLSAGTYWATVQAIGNGTTNSSSGVHTIPGSATLS